MNYAIQPGTQVIEPPLLVSQRVILLAPTGESGRHHDQ